MAKAFQVFIVFQLFKPSIPPDSFEVEYFSRAAIHRDGLGSRNLSYPTSEANLPAAFAAAQIRKTVYDHLNDGTRFHFS
ncbi:MAG: hypothetical protein QOK48_860 [Blastocatellia bacterium]|jgi:hypothetical protein|nr:hypothetical protein [Blastocatellia bacterium]